jgi:phosphate acetyltransferase
MVRSSARGYATSICKYLRLIDAAQKLSPVTTAIARPCDEVSLERVMEARRLRLIEPILVGPPARIRDVAARHGIDVADLPIIEPAQS